MSVYFASVGRYIKIGYSENPERRVRRLFASTTRYGAPKDCPLDLASRHLIRAIDGDKCTEFRIHRALDDFAIGLEWFIDEPELRDFIATVPGDDIDQEFEPITRPGGKFRWRDDPILRITDEDKSLDALAANCVTFARPA